MKSKFLVPLSCLLLSALVGCQKQIHSDITDATAKGDLQIMPRVAAMNCNTDCIPADGQSTPVSNTVNFATVSVSNTATNLIYTIKSTEVTAKVTIDGVDYIYNPSKPANVAFDLTIPIGTFETNWHACDPTAASVSVYKTNSQGQGGGTLSVVPLTYSLIGVCPPCETAFTGTAISCGTAREAIYTFNSVSDVTSFKIQGGLSNFTGTDAIVYINGTMVDFNTTSSDDWKQGTAGGFVVGQRTPGGSENRNIRVEGSLPACTPLMIRILWSNTNGNPVITGSWSVVGGGVALAPAVSGLSCN